MEFRLELSLNKKQGRKRRSEEIKIQQQHGSQDRIVPIQWCQDLPW